MCLIIGSVFGEGTLLLQLAPQKHEKDGSVWTSTQLSAVWKLGRTVPLFNSILFNKLKERFIDRHSTSRGQLTQQLSCHMEF
uniref:Uncharacterized protein n=1 Tax=Kalanchoe fedtschenkoi TaxID=63787 RepID=A0A7N0T607_KALFE